MTGEPTMAANTSTVSTALPRKDLVARLLRDAARSAPVPSRLQPCHTEATTIRNQLISAGRRRAMHRRVPTEAARLAPSTPAELPHQTPREQPSGRAASGFRIRHSLSVATFYDSTFTISRKKTLKPRSQSQDPGLELSSRR